MDEMDVPPQTKVGKPVVHSFEIDSLEWWKRSGIWIVGILLSALALFVAYVLPRVVRSGHGPGYEIVPAMNNCRQIGFALDSFLQTYGSYPNADTVKDVSNPAGIPNLGTVTSNDFFRQLIAAEICTDEKYFYARIPGVHKPDNDITGTKALEKGECGFTYFVGAPNGCDPRRPLLVTPMIPGTDRFDPKPFVGKAVVLRADNSVTSFKIEKDGHIILDGRNLMDPAHPVWQGKPPSIAWPDL